MSAGDESEEDCGRYKSAAWDVHHVKWLGKAGKVGSESGESKYCREWKEIAMKKIDKGNENLKKMTKEKYPKK